MPELVVPGASPPQVRRAEESNANLQLGEWHLTCAVSEPTPQQPAHPEARSSGDAIAVLASVTSGPHTAGRTVEAAGMPCAEATPMPPRGSPFASREACELLYEACDLLRQKLCAATSEAMPAAQPDVRETLLGGALSPVGKQQHLSHLMDFLRREPGAENNALWSTSDISENLQKTKKSNARPKGRKPAKKADVLAITPAQTSEQASSAHVSQPQKFRKTNARWKGRKPARKAEDSLCRLPETAALASSARVSTGTPMLSTQVAPPPPHSVFSVGVIPPMDLEEWDKATSLIRDEEPDPPPPMPLLFLPVQIGPKTHYALLDSGASDSFISAEVVKQSALRLLPLKTPVKVRVANGQLISVSHFVRVTVVIGTLKTRLFLRVIPTPLPIVLGYPFLFFFNPHINWKARTITITVGKREHTVPVAQAKGFPLQPLMEKGLTNLQQEVAELDAVIAAPIIPTPSEDVQTRLVLDHAFAQSAVVKPQSGREQTEQLMITKLSDDAVMPRKSSLNAAGFDLASSVDSVVPANGRALIPTDLAMVVPQGTYGRIAPRSGLAVKHFLSVGAGVIDADYRGNVKVLLFNHGDLDFHVSKGDRIAQLLLERIASPTVVLAPNLPSTARGAAGFGSTGVSSPPPLHPRETNNRGSTHLPFRPSCRNRRLISYRKFFHPLPRWPHP